MSDELPSTPAPTIGEADDLSGIAVIGMAGRFPGAGSVAELWENLRSGVESISFATPEELAAAGVDPELAADPRHVPAAGVLAGADRFDAALFGITPREAELLDPQHRVFLECAWEALEDAGYDPARPLGDGGGGIGDSGAIGVFGGASLNSYLLYNLLPSGAFGGPGGSPQAAIASDKDFLTTRVSYKLDLKGPSLDVQTACSTSLVAVVLACQSLLGYGCDLALAGGVSVREPQGAGYLYQENGILSPDGHCRPFDAAAQGTVPGNGVGIVVLKRLADALADDDTIHAILRGAALNNDGAAKVGFTAPSVAGQAEVVEMALAIAGVRPSDISYIEAHGTATPLGDPIEVRALDRVFRADTAERGFCTLGSIKSNFGHLDAAAGVAGLVKTILALEHRELPPTLHFTQPNPEIDLENGPFRVRAELSPWATDRLPRRAGVSSFGIGGTNAHVVLEEAPPRSPRSPQPATEPGAELLLLSARTPQALEAATERLAAHLERHPEIPLEDVAFTLRRGRRQLAVRRARVGEAVYTAEIPPGDPGLRPVAFLFPGQGAQHAGMAREIYRREPLFRREIDACQEILRPHLDIDLGRLLDPAPGDEAIAAEQLARTAVAQPTLFAVEIALARLWISWGVRPAAMLGHSLGELTAACLAGVIEFPDALALVALRGRLMQSLPPGAMLEVSLPEAELAARLEAGGEEIEIAAVNAPGRTVATGLPAAITGLATRLAARGVESRPLPVRHAFHSRAVEPILRPWVEAVGRMPLRGPTIPFLSNRTGTWITADQATDPAYWGEHLRRTVRFAAGLAELLAEPRRVLLEVGPGRTLAALARRQAGETSESLVVASLPHREGGTGDEAGLLGALGQLWTVGVEIDWAAFRPGRGRRVPLPTYPFERQRYWIESGMARGIETGEREETISGRERLWAPLWRESLPPEPARDPEAAWLLFGDGGPLAAHLTERLRVERREPRVIVRGAAGSGLSQLSARASTLDPADPAAYDALLAEIRGRPLRIAWLWSLAAEGNAPLATLAAALLRRPDPAAARIDVVTAGAVDPAGGEAPDPGKAATLDLCQALGCRVIDLPDRKAERLLAELDAPEMEGIVAWRGRRRWVESREGLSMERAGLLSGASCLIAGDISAGSAGLALTQVLAGIPGLRLAFLGPEPPPGKPGTALALDPAWLGEREGKLAGGGPTDAEAGERAAIDALCTRHVLHAFERRGVEIVQGRTVPLAELRRRLSLVPRHERLFESLLRMLIADRCAVREETAEGETLRFLVDAAAVGPPEELAGRIASRTPRLAALVDLLGHCARQLPQVLAGEVEGLAVLYPEGSAELLRAAVARAANAGKGEPAGETAPRLLAAALAEIASRPRAGTLRILEVGAGQGLLTRRLLPVLAGAGPVEYVFTDLGRAFVLRAEQELSASPSLTLRFEILDISRDPAPQGFPRHSFHAVVGADVVHATPRIAETLRHLRSLLVPGGLLGLTETVRRERWGDLVWGLTDGWWAFADPELRTTSPLLAPDAWERVLGETGFTEPRAWARDEAAALLLAHAQDKATTGQPLFLPVDLADPAALAAALAEARRRLGTAVTVAVWAGGDGARRFAAALDPEIRLLLASPGPGERSSARAPATAVPPAGRILHDRPRLQNPYVAPRDETERAVAEIWRRALGVERIGVDDNFLELGGDSLLALSVTHAVEREFDLGGRSFSLFESPTVAAIARFLTAGGEGGDDFDRRADRGERRRERRRGARSTR